MPCRTDLVYQQVLTVLTSSRDCTSNALKSLCALRSGCRQSSSGAVRAWCASRTLLRSLQAGHSGKLARWTLKVGCSCCACGAVVPSRAVTRRFGRGQRAFAEEALGTGVAFGQASRVGVAPCWATDPCTIASSAESSSRARSACGVVPQWCRGAGAPCAEETRRARAHFLRGVLGIAVRSGGAASTVVHGCTQGGAAESAVGANGWDLSAGLAEVTRRAGLAFHARGGGSASPQLAPVPCRAWPSRSGAACRGAELTRGAWGAIVHNVEPAIIIHPTGAPLVNAIGKSPHRAGVLQAGNGGSRAEVSQRAIQGHGHVLVGTAEPRGAVITNGGPCVWAIPPRDAAQGLTLPRGGVESCRHGELLGGGGVDGAEVPGVAQAAGGGAAAALAVRAGGAQHAG